MTETIWDYCNVIGGTHEGELLDMVTTTYNDVEIYATVCEQHFEVIRNQC